MSTEKEKTITIIVEATPHEWPKNEEISFEEVVRFEFPNYDPESGVIYSVMYERGRGNKPEGTLSEGGKVKVKEGMIFNVSQTGQS